MSDTDDTKPGVPYPRPKKLSDCPWCHKPRLPHEAGCCDNCYLNALEYLESRADKECKANLLAEIAKLRAAKSGAPLPASVVSFWDTAQKISK